MTFNEALKLKKMEPTSSANTSQPTTVRDPKKYPKVLWPYDTGVADRGTDGFTSDINVLTQKELVGMTSDDTHIKFKTGKNKKKK